MYILKDLFYFITERKNYWLMPVMILIILSLVIAVSGSLIAPLMLAIM